MLLCGPWWHVELFHSQGCWQLPDHSSQLKGSHDLQGGPPKKISFQHFTNASSTFTVNTVGGIWWFLWTVQGSSSPSAEYCTAVTATWWGCSFISISEEESRKIRRVPSLYPAATHALCLLEAGLQHTQPQDWPKETYRVWSSYRVHTKGLKSCSRWINCYSLKDCWWFLA